MRALVLEELLEKVKNRFLLTVSAARRARQLKDGAKQLIDAPENESAVIVALDEILEDKIKIETGEIVGKKFEKVPTKKVTIKPAKVEAKKESKEKNTKKAKTAKKPLKGKKKKKSRSMAA